jgi:hypothetical protein
VHARIWHTGEQEKNRARGERGRGRGVRLGGSKVSSWILWTVQLVWTIPHVRTMDYASDMCGCSGSW